MTKNSAVESGKLPFVFQIFHLFTVVVWILIVLECLKVGKISVPLYFVFGYSGYLFAFGGQKELLRWYLHAYSKRRGHWFVFLWIFTFLAMGIAASVYPDKFQVPRSFAEIFVVVITVYIGTVSSKIGYKIKHGNKEKNEAK